jgi:hypothetical protein
MTGDSQPAHDHANFATYAAAVKAAAQWWSNAAKVNFVGWEDCSSSVNSQTPGVFVIHWEDDVNPSSNVGYNGTNGWTRTRLNTTIYDDWGAGHFKASVAHELGHVLGFWHEFDRPDNMDVTCPGTPGAAPNGGDVSYLGTAYDHDSIMAYSYCYGYPTAPPTDITATDKAGVAALYGARNTVDTGTRPAVSSRGTDQLEVFITSAGQVRTRVYDDSIGAGWSSWSALPDLPSSLKAVSSPAAVSWSSTRTDVFVTASNGAILHNWRTTGGWQGWDSHGSGFTSGPTAASWGNGRIDLFANQNGTLWHKWADSGYWQSSETLYGATTVYGAPAAVSWGYGRIDIVARSSTGALNQFAYSAGWYGPYNLGGSIASGTDPGISSWGVNRLDIFAVSSNQVSKRTYDSGWGSWGNVLSATAAAGVSAVSWGSNRIDVLTNTSDGTVKQGFWTSGVWYGWYTL